MREFISGLSQYLGCVHQRKHWGSWQVLLYSSCAWHCHLTARGFWDWSPGLGAFLHGLCMFTLCYSPTGETSYICKCKTMTLTYNNIVFWMQHIKLQIVYETSCEWAGNNGALIISLWCREEIEGGIIFSFHFKSVWGDEHVIRYRQLPDRGKVQDNCRVTLNKSVGERAEISF